MRKKKIIEDLRFQLERQSRIITGLMTSRENGSDYQRGRNDGFEKCEQTFKLATESKLTIVQSENTQLREVIKNQDEHIEAITNENSAKIKSYLATQYAIQSECTKLLAKKNIEKLNFKKCLEDIITFIND